MSDLAPPARATGGQDVKLSEAQRQALVRLSEMKSGNALRTNGYLRIACGSLADAGLARFLGGDGWLGAYFQITPAGLAALKTGGGDG